MLLLLAGLGALVGGAPSAAFVTDPGGGSGGAAVATRSAQALDLLKAAARTARASAWSGTQHILSTRSGEPRFVALRVHHVPGSGRVAEVLHAPSQAIATEDVLDQELLVLLARHYELRIVGPTVCSGRPARLVEVFRDATKPTSVAGRFWIDDVTGLVLRRDVLDAEGSLVRSSEFVSLRMGVAAAKVTGQVLRPSGKRLDDWGLADLRREGWPISGTLPSGLELFEARLHNEDTDTEVLQLSYSDGLSTLSLFVQAGDLPEDRSGSARSMAGRTVWASSGTTERLVWAGGGHTWTLVSDAPDGTVEGAVLTLPHSGAGAVDEGVLKRAWRGMSRVGSWLNPFH